MTNNMITEVQKNAIIQATRDFYRERLTAIGLSALNVNVAIQTSEEAAIEIVKAANVMLLKKTAQDSIIASLKKSDRNKKLVKAPAKKTKKNGRK